MPTVLLVDDSPVVRRVLTRRLEEAGFDVHAEAAAAAAGALDPQPFACAVIDIELPDGSGCDLAATLLRRRPQLPVAFFTAGAAEDVLERARDRGAVFWKPDVDDVVAWVKTAVQPPPTK